MSVDNTELTKKVTQVYGNKFGWFTEDQKELLKKAAEEALIIKEDLLKKNPNAASVKEQIELLKQINWQADKE